MDSNLNILVVEDHDDLRETTVAALAAIGYTAQGVASAEEIDGELGKFHPDILLLDLNLPGEDGLSVARRLHAVEPSLGIIMVTARDQTKDILSGYGSGADIYVAKPAAPEELDAAIRALARRIKPASAQAALLALDRHGLRVNGPGGGIDVSGNDALLLAALAKAREHRLETWQLLELLGKEADELEKRALTVQIVRLRKKLEQAGAPAPTIKSIRGTGYQLCVGLTIMSI